jgi:hypothetical protein
MNYSAAAAHITKLFILFIQNVWGTIQRPYETYRNLRETKNIGQAVFLFLLCFVYFFWTTLVHIGISSHPLLVSFNFFKLTIASLVTFIVVLSAMYVVAKLFRGKGTIKNLFLPWSYSLLPTLVWFFATSLLWFLFPPPRTASFAGKTLSFVFIFFSSFLFFWKGVLYYLTLRFGMKLDFIRIIGVSCVLFPLGFLYALFMYRLGIFRVPFL